MWKKIIFVLLFFISLSVYATDFGLDLELGATSHFYIADPSHSCISSPNFALNFSFLDSFSFFISQGMSVRFNDINHQNPSSGVNKVQFAIDDLTSGFFWSHKLANWVFSLGTVMSFPTAPYKKSSPTDFVGGSGRFVQSILFGTSFVADIVVVGANISYAYATNQVKDKSSGWVPGIINTGLNIALLLGDNFSLSFAGAFKWESGRLISGSYQANEAGYSGDIKMKLAWIEPKWSISTYVGVIFIKKTYVPNIGIGFVRNLYSQ